MTLLRRPGVALATLLFLLTGAAFLTQVVPYRQIIESQRQVSEARQQLATLQAGNEVLQADVEALSTPEEIEKLAREKLGYVRPGETSYVVLDPSEEKATPRVETSEEFLVPETWVEKLWGFITGGDLASDG